MDWASGFCRTCASVLVRLTERSSGRAANISNQKTWTTKSSNSVNHRSSTGYSQHLLHNPSARRQKEGQSCYVRCHSSHITNAARFFDKSMSSCSVGGSCPWRWETRTGEPHKNLTVPRSAVPSCDTLVSAPFTPWHRLPPCGAFCDRTSYVGRHLSLEELCSLGHRKGLHTHWITWNITSMLRKSLKEANSRRTNWDRFALSDFDISNRSDLQSMLSFVCSKSFACWSLWMSLGIWDSTDLSSNFLLGWALFLQFTSLADAPTVLVLPVYCIVRIADVQQGTYVYVLLLDSMTIFFTEY